MYYDMVTISVMDKIMYGLHRQGRISFYMTNTGEEAVQIGSAAALTLKDTIYAQYREAGMKLYVIHLLLYASKILYTDICNRCVAASRTTLSEVYESMLRQLRR